ncbi:uncharacterized protein G2W53_026151 [Senna tora]|uniref:ATP-dependent DNA helicase n=1 Tax=Senna tora TaxID=362788 RepID=A0A834TGE5_9FABA|nr:uncharacterized protein G2W53_026151 [Senna tora]
MQGKVALPPVKKPPKFLKRLFTKKDSRSEEFMKKIRNYNMFAFTFMGGKVDHSINNSKRPYVFRLHGQNMHLLGSLLPENDEQPKFSQLYMYDTDNEISNRAQSEGSFTSGCQYDATLIMQITQMFDEYNPLVMQYKNVKERYRSSNVDNFSLKLIRKRNSDPRPYKLPTASEVAALIVGDFRIKNGERDIIVENRSGLLQHIDELHSLYLPMQYPLLFPYGEDGYRNDILLQNRRNEFNMILMAEKLTQQFIVDAFKMIESWRTSLVRFHQKKLRSENYGTLSNTLSKGQVSSASTGKRIILPSTFTGSQRYSRENFQDAMTICNATGFPDLFITFTCNPKWSELDRLFASIRCRPEDWPDLVSHILKIKLNMLIKDIARDILFGKCRADMYTIEFQKRGLPHTHILIWLAPEDKLITTSHIDSIIFAEIPNPQAHLLLYEAVKSFMMHGPCGASTSTSLCMINGKCSKHFSKKFSDRTTFDDDGYAKYRLKDIGHDKVTVEIWNGHSTDINGSTYEIKQYYDCRYISPYEASWRIFGFDINFRKPSIERLPFHLPNQQGVVFCDDDHVDDVSNASLKETKFLVWFEVNNIHLITRELTYAQILTKFVFKTDVRKWCVRKIVHSICHLYYVALGLGELHYLRVLLTFVKGPTSFEDIRTINGVLHPTFKDARYAMGMSDDDKEYIDGIREASIWSSDIYLRKLFSKLLLHNTISRPAYLDDERLKDITLAEIENILRINGHSLRDFPPMPLPNDALKSNLQNMLISEELNYDKELLKSQHSTLLSTLTLEQKYIYNLVMDAISHEHGGVFFLNGFGGSGKTFVWNTLMVAL